MRSIESLARVQVGCGPKNLLPDWWNVDVRSFPGVDQVVDVTKPWPWSAKLNFVYGEHFLEHLPIEKAVKFLIHAGHALTPHARIRLSTPSLEWVLSTHFSLNKGSDEAKIDETFAINRAFHGWGHHFLYSRQMLKFMLENIGYRSIEFFKFGESNTEALKNLERHGSWSIANEFPNTWIVEAERVEGEIQAPNVLLEAIETKITRYIRSGH